jgi:hypothetical protein
VWWSRALTTRFRFWTEVERKDIKPCVHRTNSKVCLSYCSNLIGWEESRGCYSKVTISHWKRENNPNLFGNFRVIRPLRPASAASRDTRRGLRSDKHDCLVPLRSRSAKRSLCFQGTVVFVAHGPCDGATSASQKCWTTDARCSVATTMTPTCYSSAAIPMCLIWWMRCDEVGWDKIISFFIVGCLVGSRLSASGTNVEKSGTSRSTLLSILISKRLVIFSILY